VPYIIKRYSNRKLYDPQHSRYVTLEDLKQLIRDGVELKVEDVDTGDDLTSLTLTQILLEGERTRQTVPATLLHQLIKQGEAWYELLDRTFKANPFENLSAGPKEPVREPVRRPEGRRAILDRMGRRRRHETTGRQACRDTGARGARG
jgi:polyhydroxyalkanoate synthesis repressor PhaR